MSGKDRPFDGESPPVTEIIDGHSIRVTFDDRPDGPPTTPRGETMGLALALKLQGASDNLATILTSVEGVQSTWGRVEAMAEIRKMRSLLDVLEDLVTRHRDGA